MILCGYATSAQNYPIYNGYFLNPFIYNPAAAATDQFQINAGYRRQWFGIPGAPSISSLTASSLVDQTRAGIGFKVSTFSRGFLNSTDASVSYAYGVPLNKYNRLFFGLSGGLLSNTVNLGEITAVSDPALATVSNSFTPSASFGILFRNTNGLNFGFTLPKLFNNLASLDSKYSFSYFDNVIVTASFSKWQPAPQVIKKGRGRSYKSKKSTNVPLELFTIYRYSAFGSLFEGTGKLNFNSNIWLSATYRQYAGMIPGIGISLENFTFSYFYESGVGGDLPMKSHEVLLSINLGKAKKFREKAPTPPASKATTTPKVIAKKPEPVKKVEEPKKDEKKTDPAKVEGKKIEPVVVAPVLEQKQEKKEPDVSHQPRFKRTDPIAQIDNANDTAAINKAHKAERVELQKHIEEQAGGKHDDAHNEPVNERHDFVKRGTHHEEMELGTFVIAGAFQSRANAEHYVKTLKALGYTDADFGHLSVRNLWYVFIAEDTDIPKARIQRNKLQKNRIFKDVWLLTVQE
jgi:type IX secretion system PorP/SprF family membrane protein